MSYPDLPENRLIVNGVDLAVRYNMVLLDGYTLSPPEPKTTTVEIPGRDGVLDLTESLIGDVTYNNRSMTFTFLIVDLEQFEVVKTQISNALHGRKFNFEMTMDPGYTYTGRFKITSYTHTATWNHGICGYIEVEIDAEPYKLKSHYVYNLNAAGGVMFQLPSGRKRVHPIIELNSPARLRFKNVVYRVGAGRFQLNDIVFEEGLNDLYINSYELHNIRWNEWKAVGPAKITFNAPDVPEESTVWLNSDAFGWNKDLMRQLLPNGDGTYTLTIPFEDSYMNKRTTFNFILVDAEGNRDISYDNSTDRTIARITPRHEYICTPKSETVTDSYIDSHQSGVWNEWTNTRWDELHKLEGGMDVRQKWADLSTISWADMAKQSWLYWNYRIEDVPDVSVKLEYDWKDL